MVLVICKKDSFRFWSNSGIVCM